ncbi:hypothetical protein AAK938_01415 [Aerococcaceae bacterium 50-4]
MEKQIYTGWAFTINEKQKADFNADIYRELTSKYKVLVGFSNQILAARLEDYDVVLERTAGHNHSTYKVVKNRPELSQLELALICDNGNLCFGYTTKGYLIYVFED